MSSLFFDKVRPLKQEYDAESIEGFLESNEGAVILRRSEWQSRYLVSKPCFLAILAVCSALLGIAIGIIYEQRNANTSCIGLTSRPSPITNDLGISWHTQNFNGSLLKENIYRQAGGEEVDAAWAALGVNYHSVIIPAEDAARVGLRHDQVKVRNKYGGGFPANVEGLHQLHCLNLVRQSLYYNFDYYNAKGEGAFANSGHILQKHVSHCLDILRQQLMCTVDIGVMGQVWFQPTGGPPEAWAEERQMPEAVPMDFLEPPQEGDRVYNHIP